MISFTRLEFQNELEKNPLNVEPTYLDREEDTNNNYILYYRLAPNKQINADDTTHIRKALIQVTHFHKKKLDSIEEFMFNTFNANPINFDSSTKKDTDFYQTVYRFEVLIRGNW